jgi:dihydropteroate synthase
MHMKGTPRTMQDRPEYDDLWDEILGVLRGALERALLAGVAREQIIVDPGIGFGKTVEHNLDIIQNLDRLAVLDRPILVGASRKRFIGAALDLPPEDRLAGTLAAHTVAVCRGAHIVRVHDVTAHRQATRVADTILTGRL